MRLSDQTNVSLTIGSLITGLIALGGMIAVVVHYRDLIDQHEKELAKIEQRDDGQDDNILQLWRQH